ncbi:hypothetical protein JVU11DRAFT_8578 [Chiua virens]|nr:hypothetical protein JVU11DRAFT_8578 [Chiua virens]
MPGWKLVDTHPTRGRTFQRPLDAFELGFLWDGLFNGTADNAQHFELRLLDRTGDAHLFSDANIVNAWGSTKRRYPLAGAAVRGVNGPLNLIELETGITEPHFVVQEHDLAILRPREIIFDRVTCAEDVQRWMGTIFEGPRLLSEELLVRLYVFRETNSSRTDVLHLVILMAHCVTDGIANSTFARCLLDTLARGGECGLVQIPLEARLAMAIPSLDLEPAHVRSLSPAKRRWRRAVGMVIYQLKMAKRQGGHTLPCRLTPSTPYVAAKSSLVYTTLTDAQSATVIANCRLHNITFGNAYLALAQVAMTRVLYRRYLRGEITEEEWAYRKAQPHISGGPLNLRPYLDGAWLERGGAGEFMLSISFFYHHLPFMTLGATAARDQQRERDAKRFLSDGAPPFAELLTFERFLHRAGLVKKQTTAFFSHPLFFEIAHAISLDRLEHARSGALGWMQRERDSARGGADQDQSLGTKSMPIVWAHGGSSVGNVDSIFPSEYPLPSTNPLSPYSFATHPMKAGYVTPPSPLQLAPEASAAPKIVVENTRTRLHTRPSELYLGAASSRGRLNMYVFYDGNVFEEVAVREWLDEVKGAVLFYLGRTHQQDAGQRAKL